MQKDLISKSLYSVNRSEFFHSTEFAYGRENGEADGAFLSGTWRCTVTMTFSSPIPDRIVSDLVGLVNIIVGQRAQEVLQAWDIVIVDGVDDGFHHKGVFLILEKDSQEIVTTCPHD